MININGGYKRPKQKGKVSLEENVVPADPDALPLPGSQERIIAERKLVRKLDMRVLPTIFLIFIMNYIDRNGVTTARLKGMEQDLGITDIQYATVIAILFVSYCPAQIPSNMILNKINRPSLYIGSCVVLWGLTSALTGITKNFAGIIACRVFIGLPEAAFYPGAIYVLSRWYTKKELAFRSAILYAGLMISNAFGALMAAGILSNMEGKRGIRAWRWCHVSRNPNSLSLLLIFDYFHRWLLPDYLAQARLSEDAGEADKDNVEDSQLEGLKMAVKDPKVLIFSVMTISQLLGLSFVQFFPTLTQTLGFSTTVSLLLAAPPWILASIVCCANAWHADRTGERFFHMLDGGGVSSSGLLLPFRPCRSRSICFLFLMACGYCGFAMTLVWVSNAIPRPPAKRAAAIGIVNGCGNIGNVMGSYTWKSNWGPQYHQSMAISLAALVFSTFLSWVIREMLVRENKKLDADEKAAMEGANRKRAMERRKGYRYLY
ncbi:major facilitator superfamily domain-containing protein [Infundibulicybe gibba]|nr:major facilitator superfamily domain-containing protein [Infundibulicybe gibba]